MPPATSPSPTTRAPGGGWRSSTGARRSTTARSPGGCWPATTRCGTSLRASGRRSASTRSSTSRGATASTRRASSEHGDGAFTVYYGARRHHRRRAHARARRRTTSAAASWSRTGRRCRDRRRARPARGRAAGRRRRARARRGRADRRLPGGAGDPDRRRARGVRGRARARRLPRRHRPSAPPRWPPATRSCGWRVLTTRRAPARARPARPGWTSPAARLLAVGRAGRTGLLDRRRLARRARLARAPSCAPRRPAREAIGGRVELDDAGRARCRRACSSCASARPAPATRRVLAGPDGAPASTGSSAAARWPSPPRRTSASAGSSRARRSRTRRSSGRCVRHGVPIARPRAVRVTTSARARRPRAARARARSRALRVAEPALLPRGGLHARRAAGGEGRDDRQRDPAGPRGGRDDRRRARRPRAARGGRAARRGGGGRRRVAPTAPRASPPRAGRPCCRRTRCWPSTGRRAARATRCGAALGATDGDVVVFLDTDTEDFDPGFVLGLLGPLLTDPELTLVKGAFARPFRAGGRPRGPHGGGRVTELLARPLLNLHVPELAGFAQPLAGEIAARRTLLEALAVPGRLRGRDRDADRRRPRGRASTRSPRWSSASRQNRHQSLRALGAMAYAVLVAASARVLGAAALDAAAPGAARAALRRRPRGAPGRRRRAPAARVAAHPGRDRHRRLTVSPARA